MHHLVGMAEIAEMLGVSRQRVAQLIETYEDFPKPEVELSGGRVWSRTAIESWIASHPERGPGRPEIEERRRPRFFGRQSGAMFERFTDRARASVVKAQEEARLLNHNYLGTEHLLLGLLAIGEGLAYQVLHGAGVTVELVRAQIDAMIGRGSFPPAGHVPFTPRAKQALEIALREALQLGHNYVGTEHVLLGLIRKDDAVAWKAMEALGLEKERARQLVLEAIEGISQPVATSVVARVEVPTIRLAQADARCSFCAKTRDEVKMLVAGPATIAICNECIGLSVEIVGEATGDVIVDRLQQIEERVKRLESGDAG